jgi:superoxide dismutase, Fe-Mn family
MSMRDGGAEKTKEILMLKNIERRDALRTGMFAAGLAATASALSRPATAQSTAPAGGKVMAYVTKPLAIDPKSIKGMSEKVLVSHYENNYVGAVKQLNAIQEQLASLDLQKHRTS